MELRKRMKGIILNIIIIFVLFPIPNVFGDLMGPVEVVIGSWGSSAKQFGKDQQDSGTFLPREFGVDKEGIIVIADKVNNRIQLFKPDGSLYTIINRPMEIKDNLWPWTLIVLPDGNSLMAELTIVDYAGSILKKVNIERFERYASPNSYIIYDLNKNIYNRYSPTGQLIETYKEKPLELGVVKGRSLGGKRYRTTIKYPDMTYTINKIVHKKYVRVCNELYGIYYKTVQKFNNQGEMIDELVFPEKKKRIKQAAFGGYGPFYEVVEEYGEPVVAPNGDVYTWKRTPDTYSIIKWIWIESRDAPVNLKASASDGKITLSWGTPKQDENSVKAYEIYRSSDVCGPFNKIDKVKKDVLHYTDKKVNEGKTYYYQVCAERGSGYSGYSNKAIGSIKD